MKRIFLALAMLAAAACSSTGGPSIPSGPPSGFTEEAMSGGKYRIVYTSPTDASAKVVGERTLARAAQATLDKGNEWFEIASKIDGKNMQTLVIVMGKGETLAGGPKQYDAKQTLASLKGKIG
ncbi:MAG TPA: hypothetical protein PLH23_10325 [Hyphomonadaceae bacterium]|jgi:hypothetical protein|nr:hypothetical protein [Hyphomonadaceae bacterium]HPI48653.1 hypothetical protein [Hyphomonadaceae bacterium]